MRLLAPDSSAHLLQGLVLPQWLCTYPPANWDHEFLRSDSSQQQRLHDSRRARSASSASSATASSCTHWALRRRLQASARPLAPASLTLAPTRASRPSAAQRRPRRSLRRRGGPRARAAPSPARLLQTATLRAPQVRSRAAPPCVRAQAITSGLRLVLDNGRLGMRVHAAALMSMTALVWCGAAKPAGRPQASLCALHAAWHSCVPRHAACCGGVAALLLFAPECAGAQSAPSSWSWRSTSSGAAWTCPARSAPTAATAGALARWKKMLLWAAGLPVDHVDRSPGVSSSPDC